MAAPIKSFFMFYRDDRLQRFIMPTGTGIRHQLPVLHTLGMISTMGLNKSMCDLNDFMTIRFTLFMDV